MAALIARLLEYPIYYSVSCQLSGAALRTSALLREEREKKYLYMHDRWETVHTLTLVHAGMETLVKYPY